MRDYNDFDEHDSWGDCNEEEEGKDILPNEGDGQLQTNDSGRDNHVQPCLMEEGSASWYKKRMM